MPLPGYLRMRDFSQTRRIGKRCVITYKDLPESDLQRLLLMWAAAFFKAYRCVVVCEVLAEVGGGEKGNQGSFQASR